MVSIIDHEQDRDAFVAESVAIFAHEAVGHKRDIFSNRHREEGSEAYYHHPLRVASRVRVFFKSPNWLKLDLHQKEELMWAAISAAYLHDVLEDTKIVRNTISEFFGAVVSALVVGSTAILRDRRDLPRSVKKAVNRCRLFNTNPTHAPFLYLIKTEDHRDNWYNNGRDDLNHRSRNLTEYLINISTYRAALMHGPECNQFLLQHLDGVLNDLLLDAINIGIDYMALKTHYDVMMSQWGSAALDQGFTYNLKEVSPDWAKSIVTYEQILVLVKPIADMWMDTYQRYFNKGI